MVKIAEAPYRINVQLTVLALAVGLFQLVVIPLFFLPQAPALASAVVLLLSLATPLNRALLHEAIHGRLARRRNWNDRLGRALAVSSGIAFDAIRFGHLAHHRFPRHALDRADVIEPGENRVAVCVNYYGGLLGGIFLREILASAVMLLPRRAIEFLTDHALQKDDSITVLRGAIRRSLDRRLGRARIDLMFVALIYAGSFYLYGDCWPILLVGIAARALIISLQDNVAHYGTAAVLGTAAHNSYASRWASLFMLNQNLHGVHHDRPELPWNVLPDALESTGNGYAGSYFALLIKQFFGPRRPDATTGAVPQDSDRTSYSGLTAAE